VSALGHKRVLLYPRRALTIQGAGIDRLPSAYSTSGLSGPTIAAIHTQTFAERPRARAMLSAITIDATVAKIINVQIAIGRFPAIIRLAWHCGQICWS